MTSYPRPGRVSRRRFLATLLGLSAGGTTLLASCRYERVAGPAPDSGAPGPRAVQDEIVGFVSDNHQHDAVLLPAELLAGTEATLHIQGRSGHDHVLVLTAAEFAAVREGRKVTKASSADWGHQHLVTFNRSA